MSKKSLRTGTRILLLLGLLIASTGPLFSASTAPGSPANPDPVRDCPKNLVCFTTKEAAEIDRKLITLERDLALARVRKLRRFGWNFGPGAGASLDPTSPVGIRLDTGVYLTFGFRF